jgi:hypothetical protein
MPTVKAHFAADPYPRDLKVTGGVWVRRDASGKYMTEETGSTAFNLDLVCFGTGALVTGAPVIDEKAKRAARNKRIDELMDVVEALHGETLAELAK